MLSSFLCLLCCIIYTCNGINILNPEMNHTVIEHPILLWFARTLDIIVLLVLLFVFIIHLCQKNNNSNQSNKRPSRRRTGAAKFLYKWSNILTKKIWLFFSLSFIFMILMTLNIWSIFDSINSCTTLANSLVILYHASKCLYYYILITRLHVCFGLSAYNYSMCKIVSLYMFVTIFTIFVIVGSKLTLYGALLTKPVIWCHLHIHSGKGVGIGILVWILMDLLISLSLMILFIYPLKQLLQIMSNNKQSKYQDLLTKTVILSTISSAFSILGLLVYMFTHLTILIEINVPITCICFILMESKYENAYNNICGICHRNIQDRYIIRSRKSIQTFSKIDTSQINITHDNTTMDDTSNFITQTNPLHNDIELTSNNNPNDPINSVKIFRNSTRSIAVQTNSNTRMDLSEYEDNDGFITQNNPLNSTNNSGSSRMPIMETNSFLESDHETEP